MSASEARDSTGKDLLIIGSGSDRRFFARWAPLMPVQIVDGHFSLNEFAAPWFEPVKDLILGNEQDWLSDLLAGEPRPSFVLEQFSEPRGNQPTRLVIAGSSAQNTQPLFTMLASAAVQGDVRGGVVVLANGFVRMKQQNFQDAVQLFEKAKRLSPEDKAINDGLETTRFWAKMKQATASLADENQNDAIATFKAALAERPDSPEALQGLAGVLMKSKNFSEALPYCERLIQMQSESAAWRQLVTATFQAEGPAAARATMRLIPDAVALKLNQDLDYLAMTAEIYTASGEDVLAQRIFRQVLALVDQRGEDASPQFQVQIAGLMLRFKRPGDAAQRMFKMTGQVPENLDAWEVLLAALVQNHRERSGIEVLQTIPETVYIAGLSRSGFLRSVAAIQTAAGKLEDADESLVKLADSEKAKGSEDAIGTELQLANVYLKEGHADHAENC